MDYNNMVFMSPQKTHLKAEPPRLTANCKKSKNINFFHTPKPVTNQNEKNLFLADEDDEYRKSNIRVFHGGKPSLPTTASIPVYH